MRASCPASSRAGPIVSYEAIGVVRTPFTEIKGMPIQPTGALGARGRIEVRPELAAGLTDLEGFSHVMLIYHLHQVKGYDLLAKPFLGNGDEHGIFATRAPKRPNPIGLSVLKLLAVDGAVLHVENVDMLDMTPALDIKPYVPAFDVWPAERTGWFAGVAHQARQYRADERFKD